MLGDTLMFVWGFFSGIGVCPSALRTRSADYPSP